jgi:predicted MPP superfamily phosphohydrolase
MTKNERQKSIKMILIIIIFIMCIYFYFENTSLTVTNYQIPIDNAYQDVDGFKIAQISDFHNTRSKRLKKRLIKEIEKQSPDIIAITGDLVDYTYSDVEVSLEFVAKLCQIAPVYYVTGNHESHAMFYSSLIYGLKQYGVIILNNKTALLDIGNTTINIIGINDPSMTSGVDDEDRVRQSLLEADYNEDNYIILLTHRPELFDIYVEHNIDLVFSGHAHGGQFRLPFVKGIYAPGQGLFPRYSEGRHIDSHTTMLISRGIGNSSFPFRMNNRPELVVATLSTK